MRLSLSTAGLALALLAACAGKSTKSDENGTASTEGGVSQQTGVIASVQPDGLTVQTDRGTTFYRRTAETQVTTSAGDYFAWGYLQEGTPVRVTYQGSGDRPMAMRIDVLETDRAQPAPGTMSPH